MAKDPVGEYRRELERRRQLLIRYLSSNIDKPEMYYKDLKDILLKGKRPRYEEERYGSGYSVVSLNDSCGI